MTRARTAALALVAALVLAACGGGEPRAAGSASSASEGPRLQATVRVWNQDELKRQVQVLLVNTGTTPVHVERIALSTPLFTGSAPVPKDTDLAPGDRVDLPVPYGEPVCPAPEGGSSVELVLRDADGASRDVELALTEADVLRRLNVAGCRTEAIMAAVDLAFGPGWRAARAPGGTAVLRGTLVATPRSPGATDVRLDQMLGSVLVTLRPRSPLPAGGLPVGEARTEVPVEVLPARCDLHAFSEAKKRYSLAVWLHLGDEAPQRVVVSPDRAGQDRLDDFIGGACGIAL